MGNYFLELPIGIGVAGIGLAFIVVLSEAMRFVSWIVGKLK